MNYKNKIFKRLQTTKISKITTHLNIKLNNNKINNCKNNNKKKKLNKMANNPEK